MNFKSTSPGVFLATDMAGVRLFPRVDQAMRFQVALGDEAFVTAIHCTDKGSLTSLKQI